MPTILTKKSDTPGAVPATANLTNAAGGAELAVNTADKRLFTINSSSAVVELGTNPGSLTCADASFTVARISSGTVTQLTSTSATVTTLTATSASVTNLTATSIVISNLSIASANITTLTSTNATAASLTVSTGNLTFSSTGQRITGDFSNATIANRLIVQTSTTNGNTLFSVMPNGTGTAALVRAFNSSTPAQFVDIRIDGTEAQLRSSYEGTSTFLPLTFYTGGSERMRLDTSGNLGIGTASPGSRLHVYDATTANFNLQGDGATSIVPTRSSTDTSAPSLNLRKARGTTASPTAVATGDNLGSVVFTAYGGSNYRQIAAIFGGVETYTSDTDISSFLTFSTTPAGSVTRAERMRIDSSGNVGIGTTSPDAKLTVSGGAASFADGTSSAPAIANAGDLDTGVYFPAANEMAVTTGGTVAAAFNSNGLFFRNRIINGDMRIDQRNAGAAVTINSTSNTYTVDRWFASGQSADGVFTVQQDTVVPAGFINSYKVTVTTADASLGATQYYLFRQAIEGTNVADLGWGAAGALTVTLSFWIRSSVTGTFGGVLQNATNDRNYPFTYVINAADTWEYKTITVAGDTTGTWGTGTGRGITVTFSLGAGSSASATAGAWSGTSGIYSATGATNLMSTLNATFYITGVQLETGSVATPFERRPYGTELMLCQRYYYRIRPGVTGEILASGSNSGTTLGRETLNFPVEMRVAPTALEQSGTANQYAVYQYGIGYTTCSAVPTYAFANTRLAVTTATVASGLTQFLPSAITTDSTNGATAYLGWSAEL